MSHVYPRPEHQPAPVVASCAISGWRKAQSKPELISRTSEPATGSEAGGGLFVFMDLYPVVLKFDGRSALVVGAGSAAAMKLSALLQGGARVTVVAPQLAGPCRR